MFWKLILDLPKTLLFNFYYLPVKDAIKLPFHVDYRTKIQSLGKRDSVVLRDPNKKIRIGGKGSFALGGRTYWCVSSTGKIVFEGAASFCKGTQIICGGGLIIGDGFYCNADCVLNCSRRISIGQDCLLGWKCTIIDGDGHSIVWRGNKQEKSEDIIIGDHIWLASHVSVLKGSEIKNDTVVAFGGLVSHKYVEGNVLLGGNNQVLKREISWMK